mmetsp:Transcript_124400/g.229181  ORF Transcript_124400/g.229181 Transcript_124400/m.229181 type:complete len:255 (+) Transcript_124400:86-850(+)
MRITVLFLASLACGSHGHKMQVVHEERSHQESLSHWQARALDPLRVLTSLLLVSETAAGFQFAGAGKSRGLARNNLGRTSEVQLKLAGHEQKLSEGLSGRSGMSRRQFAAAAAAAALLPQAASAAEVVKKPVRTENGVYYFDQKVGNGYSPQKGDIVVLEYKGYDSKGKLFDSNDAPGKKGKFARKFGFGQMIAGWEEGMDGMKEGGTRVMQIPPALAFGEKGLCPGDGGPCLVQPNEKVQYELTLQRVSLPPP